MSLISIKVSLEVKGDIPTFGNNYENMLLKITHCFTKDGIFQIQVQNHFLC